MFPSPLKIINDGAALGLTIVGELLTGYLHFQPAVCQPVEFHVDGSISEAVSDVCR